MGPETTQLEMLPSAGAVGAAGAGITFMGAAEGSLLQPVHVEAAPAPGPAPAPAPAPEPAPKPAPKPAKGKKRKKSTARMACELCYRAKAKCDRETPCGRCKRAGREAECKPRTRPVKVAVACAQCHDVKRMCDGGSPCGRCERLGIKCVPFGSDGSEELLKAQKARAANGRRTQPAPAVPKAPVLSEYAIAALSPHSNGSTTCGSSHCSGSTTPGVTLELLGDGDADGDLGSGGSWILPSGGSEGSGSVSSGSGPSPATVADAMIVGYGDPGAAAAAAAAGNGSSPRAGVLAPQPDNPFLRDLPFALSPLPDSLARAPLSQEHNSFADLMLGGGGGLFSPVQRHHPLSPFEGANGPVPGLSSTPLRFGAPAADAWLQPGIDMAAGSGGSGDSSGGGSAFPSPSLTASASPPSVPPSPPLLPAAGAGAAAAPAAAATGAAAAPPRSTASAEMWARRLSGVWRSQLRDRVLARITDGHLNPLAPFYSSMLSRYLSPPDYQELEQATRQTLARQGNREDQRLDELELCSVMWNKCSVSRQVVNAKYAARMERYQREDRIITAEHAVVNVDLVQVADGPMTCKVFLNERAQELFGFSVKDVVTVMCGGKTVAGCTSSGLLNPTPLDTRLLLWWLVSAQDLELQMRAEMEVIFGLEKHFGARLRCRTKSGREVWVDERVHVLEPDNFCSDAKFKLCATMVFTFLPVRQGE